MTILVSFISSRDGSVGQLVQTEVSQQLFDCQEIVYRHVHGPQMTNPTYFGDPDFSFNATVKSKF